MQTNWTIDGVAAALASKKISAHELAAAYYKRIETRNRELNAYLTLSEGRALSPADRPRAGAQPGSCGSGAGRFEWRIGGGGSRGTGGRLAGDRHRWLYSPARIVLRHTRDDAQLWPRVALRTDCFCFFARPHRAICQQCP